MKLKKAKGFEVTCGKCGNILVIESAADFRYVQAFNTQYVINPCLECGHLNKVEESRIPKDWRDSIMTEQQYRMRERGRAQLAKLNKKYIQDVERVSNRVTKRAGISL